MRKRGLSPLIATILLIAFAVALGAMIMNWSADFTGTGCAGVKLQIESSPGQPGICYKGNNLFFKIKNVGDTEVKRIKFVTNTLIENSLMGPDGSLEKTVPFVKMSDVRLELVPEVEREAETLSCGDQAIRKEVLVPCE